MENFEDKKKPKKEYMTPEQKQVLRWYVRRMTYYATTGFTIQVRAEYSKAEKDTDITKDGLKILEALVDGMEDAEEEVRRFNKK